MEDPTKAKKKDLFEGIECEISIYLFRKHNLIRWFLWIVTKSKLFENFIVVVIVFSSCKLVMDTYYLSEDESNIVVYISSIFDIVFNVIFLIEFLSKTIALGFIQEDGSYLRESWNILDFFIVVTSMIDMSVTSVDLPFLKILRMLRVLRPLRFISHSPAMKVIIWALF